MGLALDEPKENEVTTQINGIDVLIAREVKKFTDGSVVDYITSVHGEGFAVNTGYSGC